MSQMFWVKWQERIDRKKNPGIFNIARTSSLEAALAVYCSLRNDNAMLSVTVGYTVKERVEVAFETYSDKESEHIMKEYVA